ncbi:MAG: chloride channel protein [Bacteroidales bacterium]|nr:chloride channel protein [Bacteroidales bacterium]
MKKPTRLGKFLVWRRKNISDRQFVMILSVVVGIMSGFAAVIIKNAVQLIKTLVTSGFVEQYQNYLYVVLPAIGILIAVIFMHFILRQRVGHGIPITLASISKSGGRIKPHNMYSSVITSALTVGFGGSVGLEGPTVATGAAWGSNVGRLFRLNYRQVILLLACASAGAMSAIFKAPIAGIVFVLEVLMVDLTMSSLIPLLLASLTGALTSFLFLGMNVLVPAEINEDFIISEVPFYIILGVFTGLISVYFTRMYKTVEQTFDRIDNRYTKWIVGSVALGMIVFFFPALYGEGYESINACLEGDFSYLFEKSLFYGFRDNIYVVFIFFVLIIFLKVIATSITFGSGGVGGIFAPTLFTGVNSGLFFAKVFNHFGVDSLPNSHFALAGMGGLIAGVLHAPLTGMFLIAEITGGYALIFPLMITATISFAITRIFERYSVYTYQLGRRGELFTHDKDKMVLTILKVRNLIERNFKPVHEDATLGDLVKVIAKSERNIVPVLDDEENLKGIVFLNDIRHIMFDRDKYDHVYVRELMYMPSPVVHPDESMEEVAKKFQTTKHYNLPVLENEKYLGFVSRANVFSAYRHMLRSFSEE